MEADTFEEIVSDLPAISCEVVGVANEYRATATFGSLCCVARDEDLDTAAALAVAMLEAQIVQLPG